MSDVIELTENQSAEPGRCGSCHFFDRGGRRDWVGDCRVALPPHYWMLLPGSNTEQGPDTGLADNRSCDLWKPKSHEGRPVTFKQMRQWQAGKPGRD
jgi:hypothetical protein